MQGVRRPLGDSVADFREMRIQGLKKSVAMRAYEVDPHRVAEALLRRMDPRRDPVLLPPVIRASAHGRAAGELPPPACPS